jgi:hypothetical protein
MAVMQNFALKMSAVCDIIICFQHSRDTDHLYFIVIIVVTPPTSLAVSVSVTNPTASSTNNTQKRNMKNK